MPWHCQVEAGETHVGSPTWAPASCHLTLVSSGVVVCRTVPVCSPLRAGLPREAGPEDGPCAEGDGCFCLQVPRPGTAAGNHHPDHEH